MPQIGTVIVPVNFRLTAADFAYILKHSGAKVVCVHADYLDAVDSIRDQVPGVEHFIALSGEKAGWSGYEALLAAATPDFTPAAIVETEMIALNYTSGTTANPKGVMVTHRNTALNFAELVVIEEEIAAKARGAGSRRFWRRRPALRSVHSAWMPSM